MLNTISSEYEFAAALPHAIVVLDDMFNMLWWNPAANKLLALDATQRGQSIETVITHQDFLHYLSGGKINELELPAPNRPHARISVTIRPYTQNRQLLIANDITHLYQLERVRRDFVANVSHELRTPLTVIKGYIETLLDLPPEEKGICSHMNMLAQMQQQAIRIENLVTDLLLLARLEADLPEFPNFHPIAVVPLIQAICADAKTLSGSQHHQITYDLDKKVKIYGDVNELRSAFSNIVFNAVRYTAAKGKIKVRWFADDEGAHFQVSDTGIGIEAKYIPRLTERFYRVDKGRSRDAGGTGLGLAIVKHVLIRHKAELRITSELGKGSVFQCDFPESVCC